MGNGRVPRPALAELGLGTGKKARLHRILYQHGLRNGTAMFLPYDQGLEHGPRDFFDNPAAGDPGYIVKLAVEGGFNGVAVQVGSAEKFFWDCYTLYVGSEQQEADFEALAEVRRQAHRFGLPLVVWSYPRGKAVDAKGGKSSFYQVDYASRTASELGADIVKLNFPDPKATEGVPRGYAAEVGEQDAVDAVVRSAARTPVLLSGGEKGGDEEVLDKARMAMEAGALGVIFGRNVWQRQYGESLRFIGRLRELLSKYPS